MRREGHKLQWAIRIFSVFLLVTVVSSLIYVNVRRNMAANAEIKSQYTFYVEVDAEHKTVFDKDDINTPYSMFDVINQEEQAELSRIWIKKYTDQFTEQVVPNAQGLRNVSIDHIEVINSNDNIVKITFSAELRDSDTEYFDSWNVFINNGRIVCEWIVKFNYIRTDEGALRVMAKEITNSDGYSIKDNSWYVVESFKDKKTNTAKTDESKYRYEIANKSLRVSYDGGENWIAVPVEISAFLSNVNGKNTLVEGSYIISDEKTAFLYGGNSSGSSTIVPLTLIYSDDKGANWNSTQIATINNVSSAYLQFIDKNVGYAVYGHDKTSNTVKVEVMKTTDGGGTWKKTGDTPENNMVNDLGFVSDSVGFICYEYDEGSGSIYVTRDSGNSYSRIELPEPKLPDYNDKKYEFDSVFTVYRVPEFKNSNLILRVYQGDKSLYQGGKVCAKFVSSDFGLTWTYEGIESYEPQ